MNLYKMCKEFRLGAKVVVIDPFSVYSGQRFTITHAHRFESIDGRQLFSIVGVNKKYPTGQWLPVNSIRLVK